MKILLNCMVGVAVLGVAVPFALAAEPSAVAQPVAAAVTPAAAAAVPAAATAVEPPPVVAAALPAAASLAAPAAASMGASSGGAGGCRPGVEPITLRTAQAEWQISPCFGGVQAIRLLDGQFRMGQRPPPPSSPDWSRDRYAAGPLDLVDSWDAKWDPFRDFVAKLEGVNQPLRDRASGAVLPQTLLQYATAAPQWGVIERSNTAVALAWPDPARIDSPLYLVKRYTVAADKLPYVLDLKVSVWNLGASPAQVAVTHDVTAYQPPGASSGGLLSMFGAPPDLKGAALHIGEETVHLDSNALASADPEDRNRIGLPSWFAVESRYFLSAAIPVEGFAAQNDVRLVSVSTGMVVARMQTAEQSLAAAAAGACVPAALAAATGRPACADGTVPPHGKVWSWRLYTGPKDVELLKPVGHHLVQSIDFGWFGAIALPMLAVLRWGHDTTGSWPVAILLLTLLVKAILWPITMRSMRSMKKMSQLKPELDKLRADIEDKAKRLGKAVDPNELNRATFDLYRQHGVNPVGGCLPLLLQMPVYIALYRSINASVSLYNQPLFGWITDMTQKDPYYVLPLVLGVLMFAQQKVTPQAAGGDPTQQKVMLYFMPVLFTLMMLGLPSGLTLYILINTALSVVQSLVMQRGDAPAKA